MNHQFERILVGTDLKAGSVEAIRQADAWARVHGSEMILCATLSHADRMVEAFSSMSTCVLDAVDQARRAHDVHPAMACGRADRELVRLAASLRADLLVVASGGGTRFARLLLGTVAQRIVRRSCCPVLVACRSPGRGPVLAATNLANPMLPVVRFAAHAARDRGVPLIALHCISRMVTPVIDPSAIAQARLVGALSRAGLTAEARIEEGHAASAIVDLADRIRASLIVVGAAAQRRHPFVASSTPEAVIREAPCSTLVVR